MVDLILILSIVALGLFAGLMMTLVIVMERMWRALEAPSYVEAMQTFLPAAKGDPVIATLTMLPFLAPIIALILLARAGDAASTQFTATLVGTIFAVGPFVVTLRLNFPIYQTIMGWKAGTTPNNWQDIRQRFFMLNLIRMSLALAGMLCFLLALNR